jgi:hypothetical protein
MLTVPRLDAHDKVQRDARIVVNRARGLGWGVIAARHDLSERQAQTVWREHHERHPLAADEDPFLALQEALAALDAVIEDAALLAERTTQDHVQLGAIKTRLAALGERFRACGLVPHDLGLYRHEIETRAVARKILEAFDAHDVADDVRESVLEALAPARVSMNGNGASGRS